MYLGLNMMVGSILFSTSLDLDKHRGSGSTMMENKLEVTQWQKMLSHMLREMEGLCLVDFYTDVDDRYASVQMDQLLFFNHALTAPEIFKLSQIST